MKEPCVRLVLCAQRVSSSLSTVSFAGVQSAQRAARRCFERGRHTVSQRSEARPLAATSALVDDANGLRRRLPGLIDLPAARSAA